ncbi:defensin-like protein 1 isoform X1 [Lycium ferocissimum]|uniref:defensin-like protein 1 isoform X1 n=1 Tax=Lycium ferocissimum TaxID=112874 RepID=UPI002815DEDA|nr:defensin-like protein 1 isoform X1 [Lycium ferocissimum]
MNNKVILAFLFCFLLIASNEMQGGEAKVCQRRSKTWSGPCINTGNCSRQCKNQEDARFGACHRNGFGFACFCYFNC